MEQSKPYLKVASVVSAVLLVGAFVSYRAGAFERFTKPESQPAVAAPTPDPEAPPVLSVEQSPQTFMYSSKSAPAFTPEAPAHPAGSPPTYLGGSKYIVVAPTPADPPKPNPPPFLGGSKSKTIFSPDQPKPVPPPLPNQPRP